MDSLKPVDNRGRKADAGEEVMSLFIETGGDAAPIQDPVESPLDHVALFVEYGVKRRPLKPSRLWRNHRFAALASEKRPQIAGVIAWSAISRAGGGTAANKARPPIMSCTCPPLSISA